MRGKPSERMFAPALEANKIDAGWSSLARIVSAYVALRGK
jgi:hypothetical protein